MYQIIAFITAALLTYAITPLVIRLAKRFQLLDDPKIRFHPAKTHTGVVPRAGGLALCVGLVCSVLIFIPLQPVTVGIIIASILLTAVGLADDRHDVNPYFRLATNSLAALIIIFAGVSVRYITNPIGGSILHLDGWSFILPLIQTPVAVWSVLFAFLWMLWIMNIIGWSAGVDGQMPGFVAIAAIVLGILSMRFTNTEPNQEMVLILSFIVAGAFLGFLPWNFFPQKIMPGYGGKTLAGFYLGLLGILAYGKVGTALLVLGIPTLDALYTLIRRLSSHKPLVAADRGHLHHRLLELGWGKRRIALFYRSVSAILGAVALLVTSKQKIFTFLLVTVGFGGFILWLNFFTQFSKPSDPDNG